MSDKGEFNSDVRVDTSVRGPKESSGNESNPMRISGIAAAQIVDPAFTLEYNIVGNTSDRESSFRLVMDGSNVDTFATTLPGDRWYTATFNTRGKTGPATLVRNWREPGRTWYGEESINILISETPVITDASVFVGAVTGLGGESSMLRVVQHNVGNAMSGEFPGSNTYWNGKVLPDIPAGQYWITIEQSYPGYTTRYSAPKAIEYKTQ